MCYLLLYLSDLKHYKPLTEVITHPPPPPLTTYYLSLPLVRHVFNKNASAKKPRFHSESLVVRMIVKVVAQSVLTVLSLAQMKAPI